MRRLFSTFARGSPGVGLLLMRLVVGIAVVVHGLTTLRAGLPITSVIIHLLTVAAGVFLFAGLWTPVAGTVLAIIAVWNAFSQPADSWPNILLGTVGAALALLGPGAWSVDARLFGWKRIEPPGRRS